MEKTKIGRIDISALRFPPERHEYETAKYFAKLGEKIVFIKPSSIKGQKSPDFLMRGRFWETKSPIKYSNATFEFNFKKAMKQSDCIIFDLRRLNLADEQSYIKELKNRAMSRKVKILLVIMKDGRLLDIKGDF